VDISGYDNMQECVNLKSILRIEILEAPKSQLHHLANHLFLIAQFVCLAAFLRNSHKSETYFIGFKNSGVDSSNYGKRLHSADCRILCECVKTRVIMSNTI
jgi:hypothetical protein